MATENQFSQLSEGQRFTDAPTYKITEDHYRSLTGAFADVSPIHVDSEFAQSMGFQDKVMHGAILNGFISHYIGVYFAGKNGFLLSTTLKFLNPNYMTDEIKIESFVKVKSDSMRVVQLQLELKNLTQNMVCASGQVQIKFLGDK